MSYLIKTQRGTKGIVLETKDGKYLCSKVDDKHNYTSEKFAVSVHKCEVIGFIDKTKTYSKRK